MQTKEYKSDFTHCAQFQQIYASTQRAGDDKVQNLKNGVKFHFSLVKTE